MSTATQSDLISSALVKKWLGEIKRPNIFRQGTQEKRHYQRKRVPGRVHMRP